MMIDIEKQIHYWAEGAEEELNIAFTLLNLNKIRHSLFFAHLALEKILKALIFRKTGSIPPRIHNLIRLNKLSGETFLENQFNFFT